MPDGIVYLIGTIPVIPDGVIVPVGTVAGEGSTHLVGTVAGEGSITLVGTVAGDGSTHLVGTVAGEGNTTPIGTVAGDGSTTMIGTVAGNGSVDMIGEMPTPSEGGILTPVGTIPGEGAIYLIPSTTPETCGWQIAYFTTLDLIVSPADELWMSMDVSDLAGAYIKIESVADRVELLCSLTSAFSGWVLAVAIGFNGDYGTPDGYAAVLFYDHIELVALVDGSILSSNSVPNMDGNEISLSIYADRSTDPPALLGRLIDITGGSTVYDTTADALDSAVGVYHAWSLVGQGVFQFHSYKVESDDMTPTVYALDTFSVASPEPLDEHPLDVQEGC